MSPKTLIPAALLMLAAAAPAQALVVDYSGTFQGTVQADPLPLGFTPSHPESYWDGAAVSGSFEFRLSDPQYQFGADPHVGYIDPAGYLKLSYTVNGTSFVYETAMPEIELSQSNAGQDVEIRTSFQPKYQGGTLSFLGTGLFSNFDPNTITLGAGLGAFETSFADPNAAMFFNVAVDGYAVSAVPEPANAAMFGAGLLALWLGALRRRR
jgi:hypothetical protein